MKRLMNKEVLIFVKARGPISKQELAEAMSAPEDKIGYHLRILRKKGKVQTRDGRWFVKVPSVHPGPPKVPAPEPTKREPSIRLLLLAAREGIDEALARIDAVEVALLGGTDSP